MTTVSCFWKGWRIAAALWPVVVLSYLVEACLAAVLALPPSGYLAELFGHSSMAPDLLGPASLDLLLEATNGLQGIPPPDSLYLLTLPVYFLLAAFLRGGILGAIARDPGSFHWAAFPSDCALFFGRMILLLLFFIPGLAVVTTVLGIAGLLLALSASPEFALVGVGALLLFLPFLLATGLDYARISLVLDPEVSVLRHAGRAVRFAAIRFPQVLLLGLAFVLAGAFIAGAYPALSALSPFFSTLVPSFVAQQLVALLASWQRIATLGAAMALFRASH